jgi:hypothetical protein
MVKICDRAEFNQSQRTMTPEGFMIVPATLSRCGVYDYSALACKSMPGMCEIRDKLGLDDSEPLRVYRSPDHVFAEDSMASFAMKPVTNNHPPEWVNAKNARFYTVGHAGDSIKRDGKFQVANLIITDANTIKAITDGKTEISNGYEANVVAEVGVTDDGEQYHAKFTNIRGNHIAIVSKGRAGNECRISDENPHGDVNMNMKTIVLDGIEHEVSENAVQIIGKLQDDVQKVQDSLDSAKTDHQKELAKAQADLDAEKQKVADAEAKIVDGEELDAMIQSRTVLVADAAKLAPEFDCSGKKDSEIIAGVVAEVCDGIDLEGRDDAFKATYLRARFDAALAAHDSSSDGSENVNIKDGCNKDEMDEGEKARQKFIQKTEKSDNQEDK